MGVQLIFVVETNKKCKSDWIYIKDTIDYFYQYNNTEIKLSPVYMDGKGKYKNKEIEIKGKINQYNRKNNQSKVIFCFDCDNYDSSAEDRDFLTEVKSYCESHGYEFVWFCKDVERVYLGKKVEAGQKKKESEKFKVKKLIQTIDKKALSSSDYRENTSNIMKILDKYLIRK